ncbi:MAG: hypothetical protein GKR98_14155 [Boseongicola sp.]|nr:MAG: hypothetical protein GKR98_14155 [Boseongicola sp.]
MGLKKTMAGALVLSATAILATGTAAVADSSDDFAYIFEATLNEGVTVADMTAIIEEGAAAIADFDGTLIWDIVVIGDQVRGYELFENEAAFFGHVQALGDTLPKFLGAWTTDSIIAVTPMPQSIAEAFASFGAPVVTVDSAVNK